MLIDGENIVIGYQAMLAAGKRLNTSVTHQKDLLVWHPNFASYADRLGLVRVNYYMSVVGSGEVIDEAKDKVEAITYEGAARQKIRVCPQIFKKDKGSNRSRLVDISICIDALRHAYQNHIDDLYLFSGDGDFVPLVEEVMRQGKRVFIASLSNGLSPKMKRAGDHFFDLDQWLFMPDDRSS